MTLILRVGMTVLIGTALSLTRRRSEKKEKRSEGSKTGKQVQKPTLIYFKSWKLFNPIHTHHQEATLEEGGNWQCSGCGHTTTCGDIAHLAAHWRHLRWPCAKRQDRPVRPLTTTTRALLLCKENNHSRMRHHTDTFSFLLRSPHTHTHTPLCLVAICTITSVFRSITRRCNN